MAVETVAKSSLQKILDVANSALGVLSSSFNIYSTVGLAQAQIGLIDTQKHYYNVQTNIIKDTIAKANTTENEQEAVLNAKRRYLYNQATPDDLKLLIKYDLINGYINTDGEAVVVSNYLDGESELANKQVQEVSTAKTDWSKYFTKKNLMIAGAIYLAYKILK